MTVPVECSSSVNLSFLPSFLPSVSSPKRHCHVYTACGTSHSKNFPTKILMYHNEGDTSQHPSTVDIQESPLCSNWIFISAVSKYGSWYIWKRKLAGENLKDARKTGGTKLSKTSADSSGRLFTETTLQNIASVSVFVVQSDRLAFTFSAV
jgi:hypothetical protein